MNMINSEVIINNAMLVIPPEHLTNVRINQTSTPVCLSGFLSTVASF